MPNSPKLHDWLVQKLLNPGEPPDFVKRKARRYIADVAEALKRKK